MKIIQGLLMLIPLFFIIEAFGQKTEAQITFENPATVATPNGYSHVVKVDLGDAYMLILSGQVAFDEKDILVGKGNLGKQTEQIFQNIKHIVEAAGGTMDNLVKLGFFITDLSQLKEMRTVRDRFINIKQPPASTLVEVKGLVHKDLLIEIEATAVVPKNGS